MKKNLNIIFGSILGILAIVSNVFFANGQSANDDILATTSSFYIAQEHVSILQKLFGVATAPEIMMIVSIIAIIAFVGIVYLGIGFIILLLFNRQ